MIEQLIMFVRENIILVSIVLIGLFIVASVVKKVVKWVIIAIVIGGLLIYGFNYTGESFREIGQNVADYTKEEALNLMFGEGKDAKYTQNEDGTFTISTPNFQFDGKVGSNDAKLTYKGLSINIKLDETLAKFIETVKNNSN